MALNWASIANIVQKAYVCGFCNKTVGTNQGYYANLVPLHFRIYICSFCEKPTFFEGEVQTPGVAYGNEVDKLPDDVGKLYREARNCIAVAAYTASVLSCRKILMHVAVEKGAGKNESFLAYIEYFVAKHYVPPGGEGWVDHIRKKGNEANHEIKTMSKTDAEELLTLLEMLLKLVYEFPARVPSST
jgi:hypothetical protein